MQKEVASSLRALIRAERALFRGDQAARQTARRLNRSILYEVAPRADGTLGRYDDHATALAILRQTRDYLTKNVVRATLNQKGAYEVEITRDTELGDNESINNPAPMTRPSAGGRSQACGAAPVGSLRPTAGLRAAANTNASLEVAAGPPRDLTAEELKLVEDYLHGRQQGPPPPMELLQAYSARMERLSELSGATAALVNPPLSPKYNTGFVRPWDEYQAEIDIAKGQLFKPFAPIPAFFIAAVTSFALFYMLYPHVLRNFTRRYELGAAR